MNTDKHTKSSAGHLGGMVRTEQHKRMGTWRDKARRGAQANKKYAKPEKIK